MNNSSGPTWPARVFVLIPAFKAADSLRNLLPKLLRHVPATNVLIVDDGSNDDTVELCNSLHVMSVRHKTNMGKGAALGSGFSLAGKLGADWVITIDADGQHAIEDLNIFIDAIKQKPQAGIICGRREFKIGKMPLLRILSNTITSAFLGLLCGCKIYDSQCGFRAYNIKLLQKTTLKYQHFEAESEILIKASYLNFSIYFVPVQTLYSGNKSHINHVADTFRWITAVAATWINSRLNSTR